jgi:hypothetical protein
MRIGDPPVEVKWNLVYLEPMYGFSEDQKHIAVAARAEEKLHEMAKRLVGTDDLIAIYIPEGTDDVYQPGSMRGRVVGAVKLIPMPPGKTIQDYYFTDWGDGNRRWPVGWPCEVIFKPPVEMAPVLRTLVELLHGPGNFQPYVARLQHGPIALDHKMAKRLRDELSRYPRHD